MGSGCYPVLEALGIADRVTPATRSEMALHVVQAASYAEAATLLERRGLACDVASLVRVAEATAAESLRLRDAALAAAMQVAVPTNGPLAGKRVRVSTDGGRVRTRVSKRGRKTKAGRHRFTTPWKEPRLLVIDILDEEGTPDRLRLPLYDAIIADADTVVSLIIGYLRLLGAAHAQVVEFIADGAPWIWQRLTKIREGAEIAQDRFVDVLDFYHTSQYLAQTVELCRSLPKPQRVKLYERLRHALRHDADGVETILREMSALATTRRGKVMKRALEFFREHAGRMRYHDLDQWKLPVGSGQVESAVRRVVNLRFKAPGTFWGEARVSHLLHLRASFKSGRWEEVMRGVLSGQFQLPSFEVLDRVVARAHAAAEAGELFDDIVAETLITHDEAEQGLREFLMSQGVDEEVVQSFIAALQLGLKKCFGGKVDHLRITTQEEPGKDGGPRRAYVLLYDSVPGGTGYLHQLLAQDATTLIDVFKQALEAITHCPCTLEAEKDGCYRCVYQYRQGRVMELVSRDRAREVLTELVNATDQLERVPTIADIFINPNFDSALEARFIEALRHLSGVRRPAHREAGAGHRQWQVRLPAGGGQPALLDRAAGRAGGHRWRARGLQAGLRHLAGQGVGIPAPHCGVLRRLDVPQGYRARGRAEAQCPGGQRALLGVVGDQRRRQGGPRRRAQYRPGIAAHVDARARWRDGPAVPPQGRAAGVHAPRHGPVTDCC